MNADRIVSGDHTIGTLQKISQLTVLRLKSLDPLTQRGQNVPAGQAYAIRNR
jgi:hypothetical protein